MRKDKRIEKLRQALMNGTPLRLALTYAGIKYSDYRYWLELYVAVDYSKQQAELNSLKKSKSNIAKIKEQTFKYNRYQDEDGNEMTPNPDAVSLYIHSASFRKEADEAYELVSDILESKTKAVFSHLYRLTKGEPSKAEVTASTWFLERVLPTDFGKQESENKNYVPKISVEFVKSDSEASKKRIENMEKSILGDRNEV